MLPSHFVKRCRSSWHAFSRHKINLMLPSCPDCGRSAHIFGTARIEAEKDRRANLKKKNILQLPINGRDLRTPYFAPFHIKH